MPDSRAMFDAAAAMFDAALTQSKAEHAQSAVRVAKLKAALALKAAGDEEGHDRIVAEVRAEQERLGVQPPSETVQPVAENPERSDT